MKLPPPQTSTSDSLPARNPSQRAFFSRSLTHEKLAGRVNDTNLLRFIITSNVSLNILNNVEFAILVEK